MTIDEEIDMALAWSRRVIDLELQVEQQKKLRYEERQWFRAYDDFILERRDIGEHANVRAAVKAFYSEKGYGLP